MRRYTLAFALIVAGCGGNGSTSVTTTSTPPTGGGSGAGASGGGTTGGSGGSDGGMPMPGGGGGTTGTGGGSDGGTSGGDMGGSGGSDGGGSACTSMGVESTNSGGSGAGVAVDDANVYYERWTDKLGPDDAFAVDKSAFTTGHERDIGGIDGGNTRGRMFTDSHGLWAIDVGCLEHYDATAGTFTDVACADTGDYQFAQDDGGFYGVGSDGIVRRTDKTTGAVTELSAAHQYTGGIAVAGNFVYFAGDGHILRVTTTGGPEVTIVVDAAGAHQLAADAAHVYYGDGAGRLFSATATANATPTLLVTVGLGITALLSDDTRLYFGAQIDASDPYGVHFFDSVEEIAKDGSNHVQLAPKVQAIESMALDASYVYWATNGVQRHCK